MSDRMPIPVQLLVVLYLFIAAVSLAFTVQATGAEKRIIAACAERPS